MNTETIATIIGLSVPLWTIAGNMVGAQSERPVLGTLLGMFLGPIGVLIMCVPYERPLN